MNVQFVRLDEDVCEVLNHMAGDRSTTVSDLVNEFLREQLRRLRERSAERAAE